MYRFAWLALLAACRIGFDEIAPDGATSGDDPLYTTAPAGEPFVSSCAPGSACIVDCSRASSCTVQCNNAAYCDVTCPPTGCTVTGCYEGLCDVDCATGAPTRYISFATCP